MSTMREFVQTFHYGLLLAAAVAMVVLVPVMSAAGTTYYAAPTGTNGAACTPDDPGTIKAAVSKAVSTNAYENGDTVILASGQYLFTNASFTVSVARNFLTIRSETGNPDDVVICGVGTNVYIRAFSITGPALLQGVTITNFCNNGDYMSTAAAINHVVNSYGSVVATNCVFAVNRSAPGVDFRAGSAVSGGTYLGCKFIRNYGATHGGGVCYPNTHTTKAGTFVGCYFERNGSGALRGNVYVTNCVFVGNTGGSAACTDCKAVVGCAFTNNVSSGSGTVSAASECPVVDCDFYGNEAQCGGGTAGAGIRAVNCRFTGNSVVSTAIDNTLGGGGARYGEYSNCVFTANVKAGNTRGGGGGVRGVTAYDCIFDGNMASNTYSGNASASKLVRCIIRNGYSKYAAGIGQSSTATNCLIANNYAITSSGGVNGSTLVACTVVSNTTPGVGFQNVSATRTHIAENASGGGTFDSGRYVNCLITGNTATANNKPLATAGVFVNCTVVGNIASNTAAIKGGTATNSVFHGNSPTDIGGGTFVHCVYGTKTGGTFDEASVQAADPKFNRGHYPERAFYSPRVFSPLKDAGIEVGIFDANSLDLDGLPRLNGAIDIGCYEYWSIIQPTQIILQ